MMSERRFFFGVFVLIVAVQLGAVAGLGYVAWHFISKIW
jgi:hypothetical protein